MYIFSVHYTNSLHLLISPFANIYQLTTDPRPFKLTDPTSASTSSSLNLSAFSGAAVILCLPATSKATQTPQWKQNYYNEIAPADERTFLVSEAREHFVSVPPGR
jgi:hypothetical protein